MADDSSKRRLGCKDSEEKIKLLKTDERSDVGVAKKDTQKLLVFKGYLASRKGEREEVQDSHVLIDDFIKFLPAIENSDLKSCSFYAVYDGHNGTRASKFCAENLHKSIAEKFPRREVEQNLKRCLIESYKKTDEDFLDQARKVKPVWKDGSTATAILILNNIAYITNLGDSRAILCRYKLEERKCIPLTLTVDHNPSKFEERMRIQKAGGIVKDGRILGQLEVSRSVGDGQYKNHGVICIPDVKRCTLTENDRYILIACDGLWKTFSNQEVLTFVDEAQLESKKQVFDKSSLDEKSTEQLQNEWVCSKLAAEAVRRGSGDNVTVVLVTISESVDHH